VIALRRALPLMAAGWIGACAAAPPPSAAGARHESAAQARLRALAPDLLARSERAVREANAEKTPSIRRDLQRRAGLLAEAAKVEADRIEIVREVAAVERRIATAIDRRAAAERARLGAEREHALQREAASEQRDLERVFAGTRIEPSRAEAVLMRRAKARFAAAIALGADGALVDATAQQLTAAAQSIDLDRARLALAAADRTLGVARGRADSPSREQTQDLLARARERGFVASASASGTRVELADAFARGELALRAPLRRRVELLRDTLLAFPHGSLRIAVRASGSSDAELALAHRRASQLVEQLAQSIDRIRLVADQATSFGDSADLSLSLPAYVDTEERAVGAR
jgi:hypothetical protein